MKRATHFPDQKGSAAMQRKEGLSNNESVQSTTLFGQAGLPQGGLAKVFLFWNFEN